MVKLEDFLMKFESRHLDCYRVFMMFNTLLTESMPSEWGAHASGVPCSWVRCSQPLPRRTPSSHHFLFTGRWRKKLWLGVVAGTATTARGRSQMNRIVPAEKSWDQQLGERKFEIVHAAGTSVELALVARRTGQ